MMDRVANRTRSMGQNPITQFVADSAKLRQKIISGVSMLALSGIIGFIAVQDNLYGSDAMALFVGMGILLVASGLYTFWQRFDAQRTTIQIFQDSLVYQQGKNQLVVPWADIEWIKSKVTDRYVNGVYAGRFHRYELKLKDNRKLVFTEMFAHVEQLGNILQQKIAQQIYPTAIQKYRYGELIDFGELALSRQGLKHGNRELSWQDIGTVNVNRGSLVVTKGSRRWLQIRTAKIANLTVFLDMVKHIMASQRA